MLDNKAVTVLNSGVVIDKSRVNTLSALETSQLFAEAYSCGKPVVIVDNAGIFFTSRSMLKLIDAGNADWVLVAENFNLSLTEDELACMKRAGLIRARIMDTLKGTYEFAPLPNPNWVLADNISLGSVTIRRKTGHTDYGIGVKMLQSVWLVSSAFWAGTSKKTTCNVTAGGYNKTAIVAGTEIAIGCQSVQRYEIEQIALHYGWAFPEL